MTLPGILPAVHVAAGAAPLLLGPVAMLAATQRGRHTLVGEASHWLVPTVWVPAALPSGLDWPWPRRLLPVAAGSYVFASVGYAAARRRWAGWVLAHVTPAR